VVAKWMLIETVEPIEGILKSARLGKVIDKTNLVTMYVTGTITTKTHV
jgi:hypothetical protein